MKCSKLIPVSILLCIILTLSCVAVANPIPVKLQYLGGSAFVLSTPSKTSVGIDFWTPGAFTYSEDTPSDLGLGETVLDKLFISHGHDDHNYIPNGITPIYGVENSTVVDTPLLLKVGDIAVGKFFSEHFAPTTSYRTKINAIFTFWAGDIRIVHMGDPFYTMEDVNKLKVLKETMGDIDLLLMPVGSPFLTNVDFQILKSTMEVLNPRTIIPMHYWTVKGKNDFLMAAANVGYKVVNLENNFKVLKVNDLPGKDSKTIWNMPAGKYSR